MIRINTNLKVVLQAKLEQIQQLRNNPDPVLRTVALAILPELRHRVHVEGKDSAGNQIGTYSPGYMVLRTGAYKNADKVSRGPNKGKLKNAGKYTRGLDIRAYGSIVEDTPKEGKARPQYHRSGDTKVILSLTRQMENDLSVISTGKGYAIGYLNPLNLQKAFWNEETYNKKILSKLTADERALAIKAAKDFLPEYLKTLK